MDAITQQALSALNSFIESLIPEATLPSQSFELLVLPEKISPTGVGGFVGMHDEPFGEVVGRRVAATAHVSITSRQDDINQSVSSVTQALLSQDRATLRGNGVFRLAFNDLGEASFSGQGNNVNATRTATFDVLYEYLKTPEEAGGVISDVEIDLDTVVSPGRAQFLVNSEFTPSLFDKFEIVDDDQATTSAPSDWQVNEPEGRLEQLKRIRGGGLTTANAKKAGTYLLQPVETKFPKVADFILESEMEYGAGDGNGDGIGFVFRWQDMNNFYFFIMSERNGYRMFGKKIDGTFSFLDVGGLDNSNGYSGETRYATKLVATASKFELYMDEVLVLSGEDTAIQSAGRVGLMCHGNGNAFFYGIKVLGFL